LIAEKEFQDGKAGLARMNALNRLAKLHLVTDEYDVASRGSHCNDVGNGNLTCFVDKQVVEVPVKSWMSK
jgi:hypothetical protein